MVIIPQLITPSMNHRLLIALLGLFLLLPVQATSYLWDTARMAVYRDSPDEVHEPAINGIIRDADKMLASPIPVITDKKRVAPSGDKHDYFSMARYWWPDPNKPDGLPYIRQDGKRNPETEGMDRETMGAMEKMLTVYALAYFYTGKEAYAEKGWEILRAWFVNKKTRMNPSLRYSQVRMGHNNNLGSNSGLLDGYSLLIVPDAVEILSASRQTKPKEVETIRGWFSTYLDWMLTSPQGIKEDKADNNHGTAYHIQVAVYALFAGNDTVAQLYLNDFADRRILTQVEPDGRQPKELVRTRAYGYSCYNLKHILDMIDICRLQGIDLLADSVVASRIEKAVDYLSPYLGKPVSAWPFQQIADWSKEQQNMCWVLYRADSCFPDKNYMNLYSTYNTAKPSSRYLLIY